MARKSTSENNPKLVLFDIEGTLIKAGYPPSRRRYPYALKKIFKKEIPLNMADYEGKIDLGFLKKTLKRQGLNKEQISESLNDIFDTAYSYLAKNIKSDYKKRLIKPAALLVKKLYPKKNIYLGLLTGNEENVARLKISTAGLSDYFRLGLFGDEAESRNKLARLVFSRARKFLGIDFLKKNIYIIGDTPHDVDCAKSISAKTIAVATGKYSFSQLKKTKPDLVVETLADKKVINFILKK